VVPHRLGELERHLRELAIGREGADRSGQGAIVMAMCAGALRRFLKDRNLLPETPLIAAVPVSLRAADDKSMNNQVSIVRVDLATDIADVGERFRAIHASSEAAKAVVRELKPVLGVDMPVTGAPWLMTSMVSLYGRSNLAKKLPPLANVLISNVAGPATTLYLAGAQMKRYYPASIPYHGSALNITVQSYAGSLDFALTACRRILSQEESYELVAHLRSALAEIERLPAVAGDAAPKAKAGAVEAPPQSVDPAANKARKPVMKRTAAKTTARKTTRSAAVRRAA
jgi:WS/DGAT/MGAT family acyltransferase